jgi:hypothetical protein
MEEAMRICSVEGCGRRHAGRGFCKKHHKEWTRKNWEEPRKICSMDGCDKRHDAKGLCRYHYQKIARPRVRCSVDECVNDAHAAGYCSMHYERVRRTGTTVKIKKEKGICSVPGCDREQNSLGFCTPHYIRMKKHGGPLSGGTTRGSLSKWILDHIGCEQDECLMWPYAKSDGYGIIGIDGKVERVHVIMLTISAGQKPTPKHECCHSCGNRWCVNPKHLRWGTVSENQVDKVRHGLESPSERYCITKLTDSDVMEVVRLIGDRVDDKEIASRFGVSFQTIGDIRRGYTWVWLTGIKRSSAS